MPSPPGIALGGPKVHPVAAIEVDVGRGLALCFLFLATDAGALWDPGKGYREAVSRGIVARNELWTLSRAEIYVQQKLGQRTLGDFQ